MALELLAAWGIAQAAGFLFKPVLEELAKDVAKDKDYITGCSGASYKVQLASVFVPQSVRDCQRYVPQYFELPRELWCGCNGRADESSVGA